MLGPQITIFIFGACGFFIAKYIRNHKVKKTPLVCMRGFDCHSVVHSDYSKIFGIPVELCGMIYYALICLYSFVFIFLPQLVSQYVIVGMAIMAFFAVLFSVYLIGVQIFIIKKKCSWCLISAVLSVIIFILLFV